MNIIYLDLETTGTSIAKDRIIDLALSFGASEDSLTSEWRFNPGVPIPEEATEIHGITNEDVADKPPFSEWARRIHFMIQGKHLAGYNILNFDVPLLWEEFNRCGIYWDLTSIHIVDACVIYRNKEQRRLQDAAKFYCNLEHQDAHKAGGDCVLTRRVLNAQIKKYEDLSKMDLAGLSKFCGTPDRVDLAGKIVRNKEGVPVYSFGKSKDVPVANDRGFAEWMLRSDFSDQTKGVVRSLLSGGVK